MSVAVEARDLFRVHSTPEGDAAALQGLTLTIPEGEILTVLGPSGAGKTSFLRILAALDLPSAGTVRVLGADLRALGSAAGSRYRSQVLGYLDQHYERSLASELTARELVALRLRARASEREEREAERTACSSASGSPRRHALGRRSSPAASSSGSRSAPRSLTARASCSPTSRPASSTPTARVSSTTRSRSSRPPSSARS